LLLNRLTRQIDKVAFASIIGSVIEQFDFLVTGVISATVWGDVFFKLPGLAALAAAISVCGIAIFIRPIGAYLFGHIRGTGMLTTDDYDRVLAPNLAELSQKFGAARAVLYGSGFSRLGSVGSLGELETRFSVLWLSREGCHRRSAGVGGVVCTGRRSGDEQRNVHVPGRPAWGCLGVDEVFICTDGDF
jgi:hypothetical protein